MAVLRISGKPLRAWLGVLCGLVGGMTGAQAQSSATSSSLLGTNLAEVADYSHEVPFLDVFKMGRAWFTANASTFDTQEASRLSLDTRGWVRSLTPTGSGATHFDRACTLIFSMGAVDAGPEQGRLPYPAGDYVVRYEGQGQLDYRLAGRKLSEQSTPGRDVVRITPQEPGLQICITSTDPQGNGQYLKNIRVYLPGTEPSQTLTTTAFNPALVARLTPFASLRFMDWQRTNHSTQVNPSDRPQVDDAFYTSDKGVPAEVMVDLANQLHAAPWFNMPHKATDAYISEFAQVVKGRLTTSLPVYVEYSNELWNDQFSQGQAIQAEAVLQFAGRPGSDFDKRLSRQGERSAQMCTLWRAAFGTDADRVRCVMAGQAANSYIAETALDCPLSNQAPCRNKGFYGVAIAPYLGDWVGLSQHLSAVQAWSRESDGGLARLFNELDTGTELNDRDNGGGLATVQSRISAHVTLARAKSLQLLAYEGGQHLVGVGSAANDSGLNTLFNAANRDARMGTLYSRYLSSWRQLGGGLFMHFNDVGSASRFGRWGALELVTQTQAPKYDALVAQAMGCLFDWAQTQFPTLFPNGASATTQTLSPYSYRFYPGSQTYLAWSAADGHVWLLGPSTGGQVADVGLSPSFLQQAGCR